MTHDAAHSMGEALKSTMEELMTMTNTIMEAVPAKSKEMTSQMNSLVNYYTGAANLYINGPN